LLGKVFRAVRAEGHHLTVIAADLGIKPDELGAPVFGLTLTAVTAGRRSAMR
jgi:hypothetical protein